MFFKREKNSAITSHSTQLPRGIVFFVIFVCLIPSLLIVLGVDLNFNWFAENTVQGEYDFFLGKLVYLMVEWSGVMTAVLTAVLSFVHYLIKKDPLAPVICLALLCAAMMDVFHLFVKFDFIDGASPDDILVPFSWTMSRFFNVSICLMGVGIFFLRKKSDYKDNLLFIIIAGIIFIFVLCAIIYFCLTLESLPQSVYLDADVMRPLDFYPFLLFFVLGFAFVELFRISPSVFVYSLILSTLPNMLCQLHMMYDSTILLNNHFNLSHFLKVVAYFTPFLGVSYEYVQTYKRERENEVFASNTSKLAALGEMAAGIAHEISNPLTVINGHASMLKEKTKKGKIQEEDIMKTAERISKTVERIVALVKGLMKYSRSSVNTEFAKVSIVQILSDVYNLSSERFKRHNIKFKMNKRGFEKVYVICRELEINQVLLNILNNAVDAVKEVEEKWIRIDLSQDQTNVIKIKVTDSGQFDNEDEKDKIFGPFFTTKGVGKGTGLGLSISKGIVEAHGGKLFLNEKCPNTQFVFTLSMV